MDTEELPYQDDWGNSSSSSGNKLAKRLSSNLQAFTGFISQQNLQKWEDPAMLDYSMRIDSPFRDLDQRFTSQFSLPCNEMKIPGQENGQASEEPQDVKVPDWDPRAMLTNLSFLEQKIHQLQDLVHLIVGRRGQVLGRTDELMVQQQQLITADLTSIIVQLISTAGNLLPSVKQNLTSPSAGQLGQTGTDLFQSDKDQPDVGSSKVSDFSLQHDKISDLLRQSNQGSDIRTQNDILANSGSAEKETHEEHEMKDEEDMDEGENLPPGSYEILQLEKEEILAPHTHFCTICGKGFKRDANLRMHMRGHGDEYKTPAALAKPNKELSSEQMPVKRYSCPFRGCKRNKEHKKFQPLKTILCVKNHYKRTHCDKSFICSRCHTKKFSVMADLKTHEKHCGKNKWLCSCGTTFSRKDKLFGHIALFQGHTPAIPIEETKTANQRESNNEAGSNAGSINFNFSCGDTPAPSVAQQSLADVKMNLDDMGMYFSPLNFDTCNLGGFPEFPRPPFDDSESSFSLLVSGVCGYSPKNGDSLPNIK